MSLPYATHARKRTLTLLLLGLLLGIAPTGQAAPATQGTPHASTPFVLAGGPGMQQSPSLAGGIMAYTTCHAGDCDVYTLDLATRQAAPVAEGSWDEDQPSTDGQRVVWRDGRMANGQMTNYIIPTPADIPPIRVFFEENPYAYGPSGAKGIGELPMDGAAPAILNAIENATGVSFNHVPLMPEALMERLG